MPVGLALLLAAASLGLARADEPDGNQSQPQPEPKPVPELAPASRVCVENRGGFVLSFELWDTATNLLSRRSVSYASPGQSCLDLWAIQGIEEGHQIVTVVYAAGGITLSLPPLRYSPAASVEAAAVVDFSCKGTTHLFSCALGGSELDAQPGALVASPRSPDAMQVHGKGICVQNSGGFMLRVRLWDTATGAVTAWSDGFQQGGHTCVDAGGLKDVASGNPLVVIASPQGGTPTSFRSVLYDADATTSALFVCSGSTADYDCKILGASRRLQAELQKQPVMV